MALLVPDRRCALSMQPREAEFSTDGLPKAFLQSMRTLFDILDDRRRGYVHISEIESRWQGTDTRELPRGVLECLRRVAPAHGCLSFERFVAGLRSSLLHPENGRSGAACTANRSRVPGLARTKHPSETEEPADSRKTGLRCSSGYEKTGRATGGRVRSIESLALESGPPGAAPMPRSQSEVSTGLGDSRRHGRGRDEQRRHTISNGVDYSLLKRMKELEQEKDSLLQGVEVVERARDWYHQQIQAVQERQKLVGQDSGGTDLFSEACQGRLNQLLPKLQEVNRCINELLSSSGKVSGCFVQIVQRASQTYSSLNPVCPFSCHREAGHQFVPTCDSDRHLSAVFTAIHDICSAKPATVHRRPGKLPAGRSHA
uniref:Suppressor APC domain containing 2 n=1 Tax=Erpetoichthys calabaricus TaxID=27687 RepID=A0A8C4SSX1_ERPCA